MIKGVNTKTYVGMERLAEKGIDWRAGTNQSLLTYDHYIQEFIHFSMFADASLIPL
jgi:hypothetical protein